MTIEPYDEEKEYGYKIEDIEQRFCPQCAGLVEMKHKGKIVPPKDWMKFGCASDINCICSLTSH